MTPLPFRTRLQAIDLSRNIARDYSVDASVDLFGHWVVALHWGRIGTHGQSRRVIFTEQRDAARFVGSVLSRRKSAKKRIGVAYREFHRPVNLNSDFNFAGSWADENPESVHDNRLRPRQSRPMHQPRASL